MPTAQSTTEEMLAYWKELSGEDSPTPWPDEAYLGMFFQQFRPRGDGMEAAFVGVTGAEAILARLREVYRFDGDDRVKIYVPNLTA